MSGTLHRSLVLSFVIPATIACSVMVVAPSPDGPFRFTGQITQCVLAPGDTATITFRLENIGNDTINIWFSSGCQLMPYIENARSGGLVYPSGGGYFCTQSITKIVLSPGQSSTAEIRVRASATAAYPYVALPPGDYAVYVKLEDSTYELRSKSIALTVRP